MNSVQNSSEGIKIFKDVAINIDTPEESVEQRLIHHISPDGKIIVFDELTGNEVFIFRRQSDKKVELVVYNPLTGNEVFSQRSNKDDDYVDCIIQRPSGNEVIAIRSSAVTGNDTTVEVKNQANETIARLDGDGSGFLAKGNITWDAEGNLNAKTIS